MKAESSSGNRRDSGRFGKRGGNETRVINMARTRQEDTLKLLFGDDMLEHLRDPQTTDLMLNPDGKLFVKKLGGVAQKVQYVNPEVAFSIIRNVSTMLGKQITPEIPILDGELPLDGSRICAFIPPVVAAPSFTIRKKAVKVFTLNDYVTSGIMTQAQCDVIRQGIIDKKNLVILGGTGTGKTTLGNAVLHEISIICPDHRQIIIEDTGELQSTAENKINFHTSFTTSVTALVKATLRVSPDRVIVGEVRGPEALDLLQLWNTGHPGGLTTIHANDCHSALYRLTSLVSQHDHAPREIEPLVGVAVDYLINIVQEDGHRRIREVLEIIRWRDGNFQTQSIG